MAATSSLYYLLALTGIILLCKTNPTSAASQWNAESIKRSTETENTMDVRFVSKGRKLSLEDCPSIESCLIQTSSCIGNRKKPCSRRTRQCLVDLQLEIFGQNGKKVPPFTHLYICTFSPMLSIEIYFLRKGPIHPPKKSLYFC